MQIGSYEFKPALWPTLAALVLIPFLCNRGFWQLDRAAEKEARLAAYAERDKAGSTIDSSSTLFDETTKYKSVQLAGRYDIEHQFLLDNQMDQGRVGYHVFTPLHLHDGRIILVNRGWIAQGASREIMPEFTTSAMEQNLAGVLAPPPGHGILLGDDIQTNLLWPRVIQAVVLPRLNTELKQQLVPRVLLLDPKDSTGFVREWKIVQFGPEKNRGYAFQWFMMAAAVLIIFIVVNTRRSNRNLEPEE